MLFNGQAGRKFSHANSLCECINYFNNAHPILSVFKLGTKWVIPPTTEVLKLEALVTRHKAENTPIDSRKVSHLET